MRVTNMKGVDLNVFDFDFDLTFAALLMHPDGRIYHRYGGRDFTDPQSHLSVKSFVDVLEKTLPEHKAYKPPVASRKRKKPVTVDTMPWMRSRPKQPDCYHCHMVNDARTEQARLEKRFRREMVWRYPDTRELGFTVEKDDQTVVAEVAPNSAAYILDLKPGARIERLGGRRMLTMADIQRALHEAPAEGDLVISYRLDGKLHTRSLWSAKGWKEPDPRHFAWRASKWRLSPKPGFGGRRLDKRQLQKLGLEKDAFAFRVNYIVTWGDHARTGRNAAKAGIRRGDVVLSFDGKSDFDGVDHWHAWFRLTRKVGTQVKVEILRNDEIRTITLPVIE